MRITLFLIFLTCLMGLILWLSSSGALLVLSCLLLLFFIIITVGYADTAILFFLGAREVKSGNEADFHGAAVQEAYKLAVPQPRVYFYNGSLERAFVLQNKKTISLILSKELLEICSKEELSAICFELLIQVKKNLAGKRTKVMFVVGMASWVSQALMELLAKLIPIAEFRQAVNWCLYYLIHPWFEILFKLTLGKKYFRKLEIIMKDYPLENDLLMKVGAKLRKPREIYSLSSRKLIEFSSLNRSRHYQNIITIEFLPHEWDLIFNTQAGERV